MTPGTAKPKRTHERKRDDSYRRSKLQEAALLLNVGLTPGQAAREVELAKSVVQRLKAFIEQAGGSPVGEMRTKTALGHGRSFASRLGRPAKRPKHGARKRGLPRLFKDVSNRWEPQKIVSPVGNKARVIAAASSRGAALGRLPYVLRVHRESVGWDEGLTYHHKRVESTYFLLAASLGCRRGFSYQFPGGVTPAGLVNALLELKKLVGDGLRVLHGPKRVFRSRLLKAAMGKRELVQLFESEPDVKGLDELPLMRQERRAKKLVGRKQRRSSAESRNSRGVKLPSIRLSDSDWL